jgi:hypothetical protein
MGASSKGVLYVDRGAPQLLGTALYQWRNWERGAPMENFNAGPLGGWLQWASLPSELTRVTYASHINRVM